MAVEMERPPVTITSQASGYVTAGALRLVTQGYLARLRYDGEEDGHFYYQIPSESVPGTVYTIDYSPRERTLRCSCKAGQHNVPCKHVRLLQFRNGWTSEEGRA